MRGTGTREGAELKQPLTEASGMETAHQKPGKNEKSSTALSVTFILDSCFTLSLDDNEFSIIPRLLLRDGVVSPEIVPTFPKMSLSRAAEDPVWVPTQQAVAWCSTSE